MSDRERENREAGRPATLSVNLLAGWRWLIGWRERRRAQRNKRWLAKVREDVGKRLRG